MGLRQTVKEISLADVCIFGGLCLLGIGLWWYAPWISFTITGSLLFLIGLRASIGVRK